MNRRRWIALVLWGALACADAKASAQDAAASSEVARAEAFAGEAFEAYSRKDFEQAVALYQKALEASPSADIIYNLARIYDTKLKDRKRAIEFYQRYTQDTGADPDRVRAANQRLQELRELEAAANEPPAKRAPPVATAAELTAPPAKAPPPTAASGLTGVQVAGLISGGVGLAGLGVGIGFGVAAKSDADLAHETCDGNACSTQEGVDAAENASREASVSTVAFIAGGALTALGLTLLIAGGSGDDEEHAVSVRPALSGDLLGAVARGRF